MTFLNPFMLFGLAAVAVPIAIHLLNRRKVDRVVWAAMRFLRTSIERNQRRLRLEDLLLLAVRCALLVLLVLALARPAVRSGAAAGLLGRQPVTAVILLDHSASMGHGDGVKSRFHLAREAGAEAISALPPGSSVAVFLASDTAQALIPEPTFDLALAARAVREAPMSHRSSDLLPAVRRGLELLEARNGARELYVMTDGQLAGWRELDAVRGAMESARGVRTHIVLTHLPEQHNLGVSDLRAAGGVMAVDRPVRFVAQVTNHGTDDAAGVRVSLRVNDEPAVDEAMIDHLPAGSTRSVAVYARLRDAGTHTVTAALPPDRMPADDQRTIAVRALERVNVLVVEGNPGRGRDGDAFFLRHALAPVPAAQVVEHYVRVETVWPGELDRRRLDNYHAVLLADVADLPEAAVEMLESFVRRGGGLLVFPGPTAQRGFYNRVLFEQRKLLPARLGDPLGEAEDQQQFATLQGGGFGHPIAAIWNDGGAGTPASARFFRWYPLLVDSEEPGAGSGLGDARVVLAWADGAPAVMERPVGLGRVVLFSSTAGTAWNDLAARPGVFVPLVQRTLGSILARQDESLNTAVGGGVVQPAPHNWLGRSAWITGPGDAGAVWSGRVEMAEGETALRLEWTELGGTYVAQVEADEPVTLRFAAQPAAEATSLAALSEEQIARLGEVANVVQWQAEVSLAQQVARNRSGTELWLSLLAIVLALAVSETVLAHWFSRSK